MKRPPWVLRDEGKQGDYWVFVCAWFDFIYFFLFLSCAGVSEYFRDVYVCGNQVFIELVYISQEFNPEHCDDLAMQSEGWMFVRTADLGLF